MMKNILIGIGALIGGILLERKLNVSSKVLKKSESTIEWAKEKMKNKMQEVQEKMQEETAESKDTTK